MKASPIRPWMSFLVVVLLLGTAIYPYAAPPAVGFMSPNLARILFFHLPCALVSSLTVFLGGYWAIKTISNPSERNDIRLSASWELSTVLAILTLTTGIIFSKVQWGEWWNWDPRQTSYMFVTLLLLGGLALRAGISDERKRATAFSGYSLVMLVPIAFLTFVYPRLPQVRSLHPLVIQQGTLGPEYRAGVLLGFCAIGTAIIWLWKLRVYAGELELEGLNQDGKLGLENRSGHSGSDGADRPVVVPRGDA